jgi:hypothetical protein
LQSELAAFQNRANTGNDMVLPLDSGKQMSFEAFQDFDCGGIRIHELLAGLGATYFNHWRTA